MAHDAILGVRSRLMWRRYNRRLGTRLSSPTHTLRPRYFLSDMEREHNLSTSTDLDGARRPETNYSSHARSSHIPCRCADKLRRQVAPTMDGSGSLDTPQTRLHRGSLAKLTPCVTPEIPSEPTPMSYGIISHRRNGACARLSLPCFAKPRHWERLQALSYTKFKQH
jgi:hypothetical protein